MGGLPSLQARGNWGCNTRSKATSREATARTKEKVEQGHTCQVLMGWVHEKGMSLIPTFHRPESTTQLHSKTRETREEEEKLNTGEQYPRLSLPGMEHDPLSFLFEVSNFNHSDKSGYQRE